MLVLGIRYLNGFAVASHGTREQVEWPPHPARVFMALVAAHYETGADPAERKALLTLENVNEPPTIHAPGSLPRPTVTHFVPVNDNAAQHKEKQGKVTIYQEIQGTPFRRNRQPRTFARAWLERDTVFLSWPNAQLPPEDLSALARLCAKVTRIGHSSSLVQMWLAAPDEIPSDLPCWVPDNARATCYLRVPCPGNLQALDEDFHQRHERARDQRDESKSRSPVAGKRPLADQGYARTDGAAAPVSPPGTVFSPHLLLFALERRDGPYRQLDLACTLAFTERWREALASRANDLSPEAQEIISGHAPDRKPLERPHLAFLPLPVVGHEHADGHLMGVALALPADLPSSVRLEVLGAVDKVAELALGRLGKWRLERILMARPPVTLRVETWTGHPHGGTHWSSVTPFAFDYHPKQKPSHPAAAEPGPDISPSTEIPAECRQRRAFHQEAADLIADACQRVGLPRPREVIVSHVSAHLGVPPAPAFPRLRRKDGTERRHTHAILVFDQPVVGPVLLGAGRYRGYGFFRPMEAVR